MIGNLEPQPTLAELMRTHGYNGSQLSRALGVSQPTVSRWLRGIRKPTEAMAHEVAELLSSSAADVWTYRLEGGER